MADPHESTAKEDVPAGGRGQKSVRFGEHLLTRIEAAAADAKITVHRYIVDATRRAVEGEAYSPIDAKLYQITHLTSDSPTYFLSPKPDYFIFDPNAASRVVFGIKAASLPLKLEDFIDQEIQEDDEREVQSPPLPRRWGPREGAEKMRENFRSTFLNPNKAPPRVFQEFFTFTHDIFGAMRMKRVGLGISRGRGILGWGVTHNLLSVEKREVFDELMESHVEGIIRTTGL